MCPKKRGRVQFFDVLTKDAKKRLRWPTLDFRLDFLARLACSNFGNPVCVYLFPHWRVQRTRDKLCCAVLFGQGDCLICAHAEMLARYGHCMHAFLLVSNQNCKSHVVGTNDALLQKAQSSKYNKNLWVLTTLKSRHLRNIKAKSVWRRRFLPKS